jgi:hypothetical protein
VKKSLCYLEILDIVWPTTLLGLLPSDIARSMAARSRPFTFLLR